MNNVRLLVLSGISMAVFVISGCSREKPAATPQQRPETLRTVKTITARPAPSAAAEVKMPNTPPYITSINVYPPIPVVRDKIRAEAAASDREGDTITILYQWSKNDVVLHNETTDTLELGDEFSRGDKIALRIIPEAERQMGNPINVNMVVANAPPVIIPPEEIFRFDGRNYTEQVKATDADGDTITYSLKNAPEGMTIDSSTGIINWDIPQEVKGDIAFTVSVTDGNGGEVLQNFALEIKSTE